MNRLVGLSLLCLTFVSAQAEEDQDKSEFEGNSWSLYMSQHGNEPVQVQWERKNYDKTGVTLHRKGKGRVENGKYKPDGEEDVKNLSESVAFPEYDQDEQKINKEAKQSKGPYDFWNILVYPFGSSNQEGARRQNFRKYECRKKHRPIGSRYEDSMEDKLSQRSRVSFYRPVERMFEKIFGSKKGDEQNAAKKTLRHELPYVYGPNVRQPIKAHPIKRPERRQHQHWFEDFERHQRAVWKQMLEFEKAFFSDFYEEE